MDAVKTSILSKRWRHLSPVPKDDANDLGGGVGVADSQLQLANRLRTPTRSPLSILGLGPPIGDPNPSTEVAGTHEEHRRPWWKGRGR
ncbi:hypothetical protein CRG98_007103 [Punica granatum]|uniref:Uncharacterized protein n=1 Tax=Punica granatum TaxID=22663 RepID=A0A2I0KVZ1_PUNGR|nr:hypothetical protein CRG98_007103 [Punica granatum]